MRLVDLAGYDPLIVARLTARERRFFAASTVLTLLAALGGGLGAAYGAMFPFGFFGVVVGIGFAAFMVNLVRLVHAGSGYPVHLPLDEIDVWHPSATAGAVLTALGLLLSQPLVVLVLAIAHGAHGGLVDEVRSAWSKPLEAGALTAAFTLLIAIPGWMRVAGENAVRAYERERWIEDRIFVDDAFASAQDTITALLSDLPGFHELSVHYLDPPYNTKPLLYGLDPSVVVRDQLKFVRAKSSDAPEPQPHPVQRAAPVEKKASEGQRIEQTPSTPNASRAPDESEKAPDEIVGLSFDDSSQDNATEPPAPAYFDVGRLQVKRAKEHLDVVVPFVSSFTGQSESEVREQLSKAPDDARLHQVFTDWKKLRTILLKDAGFALDRGLAPIVSVIVQKPVVDVERRLRAAPREKRLTGVFAPELARRLLRK